MPPKHARDAATAVITDPVRFARWWQQRNGPNDREIVKAALDVSAS